MFHLIHFTRQTNNILRIVFVALVETQSNKEIFKLKSKEFLWLVNLSLKEVLPINSILT